MGALSVRAYPDSCVLIYLVEGHPQWARAVRDRLQPAQNLPPALVFSELTRLECTVQPIKTNNDLQLQAYEHFFANGGYSYQPMTRQVFELATQLRAQHGLKTPDALHLAAAITAGCDEFWTHDQRLAQAAQDRLQIVTFESTP